MTKKIPRNEFEKKSNKICMNHSIRIEPLAYLSISPVLNLEKTQV